MENSYDGADKEEVIENIRKEPVLVEYARSFFPVILIVLLLRSFLVEPFRIPSGSMIPTLKVGDFILVNKFAYGIRLPVTDTKVLGIGEPHRGDVAVFRYPKDPSVDYIKRVIGLPGDRISYRNKTLYINGKRISTSRVGPYTETKDGLPIPGANRINEQLTPEIKHDILLESMKPTFNGEWIVPEGHYFMMGDNRDNSNDSRYWGFVPEANLVGKAFMIWMNLNIDDGGVEWSRIGNSIE
ncbi:MAG: signal peptidase I [Gammaproteobacteria bacterium]|nr:signal peptidase I [Gammaproteobacteria bacterium]